MKSFKLFFLFFLLSFFSYSQIEINGIVKDSLNTPIEFANVILVNQNNKIVSGGVTDEKGQFKILVEKGNYKLTISFIGFQDWVKNISLTSNLSMGVIILNENKSKLDEVIIIAEKPLIQRKVDRLVFNVENSISASGGDALDALKISPGVRVEADNIGLIGKSSVKVLINDRLTHLSGEDLSNYLRSLSSDNISKIEVITNPPAKYEAEGNSGLINIVLKKTKGNHFNGNIRTTYRQATYARGFLGGGITYQKNKWSFFTNANSGKGSIEANETNKIFYPSQTWDTDTKIRYFTEFIVGRAGIDYDISDNTSIGVQYLGSSSQPDNKEKTKTNIFNDFNVIDSLLSTQANADKKIYYHSLNGHLKTVFDTIGRSMTIDFDYFKYNSNLERINTTNNFLPNNEFIDGSEEIFKNDSKQNIQTLTSRVDFKWPIKFANLEFGGKLSFIQNDSEIKAHDFQNNQFIINPNQSNIFDYKENTQAIYTSASKSLKKWNFKIGFRLEFTQTEGNSITLNQTNKNDYIRLFPTAYITYNLNDNNLLSLNYGKRINRPEYRNLNPFRWFNNPYSYSEGNPFLQPYFIDNFELSHLYKNNLNTSLYFSSTKDGSDQITFANEDTNIQATVLRNFLNEHAVGISQSYTFKSIKWLKSYLKYDLNYSRIKSNLPNTIEEQSGFNFYSSIDNSLYLNTKKTFFGELNFWYSAPGVSGVDKLTSSYAADMGLKWLLFEKQIQINLVFSDIFKTNRRTIKSIVSDLRQEYRNYYDSQQLRFSVLYRFGNNKIKSKRKRFSNEEERKRTN